MIRSSWIVFGKELVDHLRDRRAVLSALFGVIVGPALITLMLTQIARDQGRNRDTTIPVAGAEHAPALVDWLKLQSGVTIEEAPEDAEAQIRDGELKLALVIDGDYQKDFSRAKPAEVKLIFDGSDRKVGPRANRVRRLVRRYAQQVGALRLIARGVSPAAAAPINLRDIEVSTAQSRAARILAILPMMILLAGFAAGMGAAADSTAGERERGSLEALLVNPAPAEAVVAGKWLAAASLAVAGSLFSLVFCALAVDRIPLQELGLSFRLESWQLVLAGLTVIPAAMLAPALQMLVCSFSRTLKEAQSYLGFLIILPMAPGMLAVLFNLDDSPWMTAAPFFGQTQLLGNILAGEAPAIWQMLLAALSAFAAIAICLALITRLFKSEQIVLSR